MRSRKNIPREACYTDSIELFIEDQAFSPSSYDFALCPLYRQQVVSLSQSYWVSSVDLPVLTEGEPNHTMTRKPCPLEIIQYSLILHSSFTFSSSFSCLFISHPHWCCSSPPQRAGPWKAHLAPLWKYNCLNQGKTSLFVSPITAILGVSIHSFKWAMQVTI